MDEFIHKRWLVLLIFQDCHEAGKETLVAECQVWRTENAPCMVPTPEAEDDSSVTGRGPCEVNPEALKQDFLTGAHCSAASGSADQSQALGQKLTSQSCLGASSSFSGAEF